MSQISSGTYTEKQLLFIKHSNVTEHPVFSSTEFGNSRNILGPEHTRCHPCCSHWPSFIAGHLSHLQPPATRLGSPSELHAPSFSSRSLSNLTTQPTKRGVSAACGRPEHTSSRRTPAAEWHTPHDPSLLPNPGWCPGEGRSGRGSIITVITVLSRTEEQLCPR